MRSKFWIQLFLTGFLLFFTISCKKDDIPIILTSDEIVIFATSAILGGNITSDGGAKIKSRGVCWSTIPLPTIDDNKTSDGSGSGSFTSNVKGLNPNTKYYIRSYATNRKGTSYGNQLIITTFEGEINDIDGNTYPIITIGTQVWMAMNLSVTHYRNGESISLITENTQWNNMTTEAYCNYNNATYGRLYNWYAVNDNRKIAPAGWHVPTDAEWTTLINYAGGFGFAGYKLKEEGSIHWLTNNDGLGNYANNETKFTALPGGCRSTMGGFFSFGYRGSWWTASENGTTAWYYSMCNYCEGVDKSSFMKTAGFSVRCIRD